MVYQKQLREIFSAVEAKVRFTDPDLASLLPWSICSYEGWIWTLSNIAPIVRVRHWGNWNTRALDTGTLEHWNAGTLEHWNTSGVFVILTSHHPDLNSSSSIPVSCLRCFWDIGQIDWNLFGWLFVKTGQNIPSQIWLANMTRGYKKNTARLEMASSIAFTLIGFIRNLSNELIVIQGPKHFRKSPW